MAINPKHVAWPPCNSPQSVNVSFHFSTSGGKSQGNEYAFTPPTDIYETSGEFVVEIEAPGLDPADFFLTMCEGVLTIEGYRQEKGRTNGISYLCFERHFGRFFRAIEIPSAFDPAGIVARYENGVLVVVVPRNRENRVMNREIPNE